MPGMKVTLSAAMRARDVSRPHAENEVLASAGEADEGGGRERGSPARPARPAERSAAAADANGAVANGAEAGSLPKGRRSHRRRRRR